MALDLLIAIYHRVLAPKVEKKNTIISWYQAANIHHFIPNLETEWICSDIEMGERAYAVTVKDDSMEPRYEQGAILMVGQDFIPTHRRIVIVYWKKTKTISCTQLLIDSPNRYLKPHNINFYLFKSFKGSVISESTTYFNKTTSLLSSEHLIVSFLTIAFI